MKEKQYLEIKRNGITLGAFENVTKFEETENGFKIESADGNFEFEKLPSGIYVNKPGTKEFPMVFDSYKLCGRRTFRRHSDEERSGIRIDLDEEE